MGNGEFMKIVFMGTPDFSVPCLKEIADKGYEIPAVFTQPDRPKGRGYKMIPTPVKACAQEFDIPVYQPLSLRKGDSIFIPANAGGYKLSGELEIIETRI